MGRHSQNQRKARIWIWALAGISTTGLALLFWSCRTDLFPQGPHSTVLVLDDCDEDFRTPPFEDTVIALRPNGRFSPIVTNLNICQTIGGGRSIAVSDDRKFFVVCETVGKHLTAYEMETGKRLWSVDGEFTAVAVARDGLAYAVVSSGTIYGQETVVVDQAGRIVRRSSTAGFDVVLDNERKVLWEVAKGVRKCDLDLNVLKEINPIKWCASSVDLNKDGSIWVAEREHPDVKGSTNRILKISSDGQILKSLNLDWSPSCLRVDHSDGCLWVTGGGASTSLTRRVLDSIEARTGRLPLGKTVREFLRKPRIWLRTHKYDPEGKLICTLTKGGYSLDIDQSDGSLWLATQKKVYHYSREGGKLGTFAGTSGSQKWITVVQEERGPATPP